MKTGRIFSFKIIFFIGLCMGISTAQAASVSYYLDKSNDLPDGVNYLQVTISDDGENINFLVDVLEGAFTATGDNFGMDKFFFNYDNTLSVDDSNIANIDPSSWKIKEDKNAGGDFGFFEFELLGPGARTDQLSFSITDVEDDTVMSYAVGNDVEFFAAHVGGFDETYNVTSAQFAGSTPVPVPSAAYLLGSGLIFMVGLRRRKKN